MKAFVARPRSKAVGAVDATLGNLPVGPIQDNINLQDFGFGRQPSDHSGQFNRSIQKTHALYLRLFGILE